MGPPSPAQSVKSLSFAPSDSVVRTPVARSPPSAELSLSPPLLGQIAPIASTSLLHAVKEKGSIKVDVKPNEEEPAVEDKDEDEEEMDDESDEDDVAELDESIGNNRPPPLAIKEENQIEVKPDRDKSNGTGSVVDHDEDEERDDGTSSSEEEEEHSESDEEDDEPTLKYARLEGGTTDILKEDNVSALAVSPTYVVSSCSVIPSNRSALTLVRCDAWDRRWAHMVVLFIS